MLINAMPKLRRLRLNPSADDARVARAMAILEDASLDPDVAADLANRILAGEEIAEALTGTGLVVDTSPQPAQIAEVQTAQGIVEVPVTEASELADPEVAKLRHYVEKIVKHKIVPIQYSGHGMFGHNSLLAFETRGGEGWLLKPSSDEGEKLQTIGFEVHERHRTVPDPFRDRHYVDYIWHFKHAQNTQNRRAVLRQAVEVAELYVSLEEARSWGEVYDIASDALPLVRKVYGRYMTASTLADEFFERAEEEDDEAREGWDELARQDEDRAEQEKSAHRRKSLAEAIYDDSDEESATQAVVPEYESPEVEELQSDLRELESSFQAFQDALKKADASVCREWLASLGLIQITPENKYATRGFPYNDIAPDAATAAVRAGLVTPDEVDDLDKPVGRLLEAHDNFSATLSMMFPAIFKEWQRDGSIVVSSAARVNARLAVDKGLQSIKARKNPRVIRRHR